MSRKCCLRTALGIVLSLALSAAHAATASLKIGYSDWPGWVAWQVAIDKGWLKEVGVDASFEWFDYSASMDAFTAGKIDRGVGGEGETPGTGAGGGKKVIVMLSCYFNGNDTLRAKPAFKNLKKVK